MVLDFGARLRHGQLEICQLAMLFIGRLQNSNRRNRNMMTMEELRGVAEKQRRAEMRREAGLPRRMAVDERMLETHALVLTGVRRCGKSTLMTQRIREGGEGWFYLKFDAPQLVAFELQDSARLDGVVEESGAKRLYFDEIHEVEGWELYVLEKLDEGYRVCVTGSNASLLKGERAGKLTGRHVSLELFPFSYAEYLAFTGKEKGRTSVEDYLKTGGFPRYVQTGEETHLAELFDDIVQRDVVLRHGIRDRGAVERLAWYLAENPGCRFSATRMLEALGVKNASTVTQWCDWLEDAYLFFFVPRHSDSARARLVNPRKVYCVDTGMLDVVSTRLVFNDALRFENLVFLALRRAFREICYFDEGAGECDFVAARRHRVEMVVQACVEFGGDNARRELRGVRAAMARFGLKEGWIVTLGQREEYAVEEGLVRVVPFEDFAEQLEKN